MSGRSADDRNRHFRFCSVLIHFPAQESDHAHGRGGRGVTPLVTRSAIPDRRIGGIELLPRRCGQRRCLIARCWPLASREPAYRERHEKCGSQAQWRASPWRQRPSLALRPRRAALVASSAPPRRPWRSAASRPAGRPAVRATRAGQAHVIRRRPTCRAACRGEREKAVPHSQMPVLARSRYDDSVTTFPATCADSASTTRSPRDPRPSRLF